MKTKIRIPEANPNIIQRLSLFEKLNSGLLINESLENNPRKSPSRGDYSVG